MQKETVIQAKTFTCQYIKREDRLLLTVNYKDISSRIDFWITRSFLLKLLPYFFEYSTTDLSPATEQKEIQNTTPTDNSTFLLTQKEPVLLDSVDFSRLKDGDNNIQITLKNLEKKIYCTAVLDEGSFKNFTKHITNTAPVMEWGIFDI